MAVVLAGMLVLAAAQGVAEPSEEVVTLAETVGLDATELQGAVLTVGSTPRAYLIAEGLLSPPPRPPVVAGPWGMWERLAACESSGDWSAVSRSGVYRGGLQFDQPTWAQYGGRAYASSAHLATKAQQIAVAERLRAARGMQPWPVCGRRV